MYNMYTVNSDTKIHILCFPFNIRNVNIRLSRKIGILVTDDNALQAWGKKHHFYPWGLERKSGWAIFTRVGKLQLNRQWYGKRHICAFGKLATQSERKCARHSTDDEYRARSTMRLPHVRRSTSCARPTLLFSLAGCSMNRKPDFNPSWQWRDADTKIRRNNSYPRNPTPGFKRFWN